MLDAAKVEERLCNLETDMYRMKKTMLHRDEVKEQVWNDLQEQLLAMVKQGFEKNDAFQDETKKRFERLEDRVGGMEKRMGSMESDISDIKSMLRQALKLDQ